jgi:tetratricopeptide (TPR) repeat protein
MLYLLLRALLIQAKNRPMSWEDRTKENRNATILAFLCAAWFIVHPIAVYGAAYLAQRTILFATLFSLASMWLYRRALAENRTADIVSAAVFYTMAVFSKEHAIMLPFAAVALTVLYDGKLITYARRIGLYLALCLPAASAVLLMQKNVIANTYEPDVGAMMSHMQGIPILDKPWGQWLVSIVLQMGLFFHYIAFWMVPDVRALSVDMRIDFVGLWFSATTFLKAFLFLLSPILALYFSRRKGIIRLFCCGFLYCWLVFLTELATVRFQEPFVLYRSYIWAPGYAMMAAAVGAGLSRRWLLMLLIPILFVCFLLARERLFTLQSEAAVWKDAASKLASTSLPGGDRILFNRGRTYLLGKKYQEAIGDFSVTIQQSPGIFQAYYNRAIAYYSVEEYGKAMDDLNRAWLLKKDSGPVQYVRGLVLERCGDITSAKEAYSASAALGDQIAKIKLAGFTSEASKSKTQLSRSSIAKCSQYSAIE